MSKKRLPLPKRFSVALTDKAYENLRSLNEQYNYGNNYLLTILLEHLDEMVDRQALDKVLLDFEAGFGVPSSKKMK